MPWRREPPRTRHRKGTASGGPMMRWSEMREILPGCNLRVRMASQPWTPLRGWIGLSMLIVICVVTACRSTTEPLPSDAERFEPPAVYARWWAMTEACSGRSGDLAAVQWYRVPGALVRHDGEWITGYYELRAHRIVLGEDQVDNGIVVRHEMLHALLRVGGHPRAHFLEACRSILDCSGVCATDGGPWRAPRPDYVVLPPDSLEIDSRAELLPPEADGQRFVALQVMVRNPSSRAVVIAAPGNPATPNTFAFDVRGPLGGIIGTDIASDSSTLFFQPYETKRRVYDFRVASELTPYRVPPGTHWIAGGYARQWAAHDTVIVAP